MSTISVFLLLVIVASAAVIWLFLNPIKIWLCEKRICGVIVPANHVTPVFKGGSFHEWACPTGLKIVNGKLEINRDGSGNLLPPGNPGDNLGIWWKGWLAWFFGYRFPKADNDFSLPISKVRKKTKANPGDPIVDQFERRAESITDLRRNINRFIMVNAVELDDGSTVNVVLYAAGGVVKDPHAFWIQHGKEAFGIWESRAASALSGLLEDKSFEEFFRSDDDPYTKVNQHLNAPGILDLSIIGIAGAEWSMEQWEDTSAPAVKAEREKLAKTLADQKSKQETARQRVKTAEETEKAVSAEQKVAEKRAALMTKLAGNDETAKSLASIALVAEEVGPQGFALAQAQLKVKERAATPELSVLVESGSSVTPMLPIPTGKPENQKKEKEGK